MHACTHVHEHVAGRHRWFRQLKVISLDHARTKEAAGLAKEATAPPRPCTHAGQGIHAQAGQK